MKNLCRFFPFYGAKHRSIGSYPQPRYTTVIEPFAGSAAYATRYYWLDCVLCDVDPVIYSVWEYLVRSTEDEIKALPANVLYIQDLADSVPQEAKWLIGFWLQPGGQRPATKISSRGAMRPDTAWSKKTRDRTAFQASKIKHWKLFNCSYAELPNVSATLFVDPPYSTPAGRHYVYNEVDYSHLGNWCKQREGHVVVCEQSGADWLPFNSHSLIHSSMTTRRDSSGRMSHEVIYEQYNG